MEKIPVDAYGIGSSIIHGENDFTADIVEVEGRKTAKAGREFRANNKLKKTPAKTTASIKYLSRNFTL